MGVVLKMQGEDVVWSTSWRQDSRVLNRLVVPAEEHGLSLFGERFTGTPNVGFGLSDNARGYRVGWRLTSAVRCDPGFRVDLDAMRREAADGNAPAEHGVMLRGSIRW